MQFLRFQAFLIVSLLRGLVVALSSTSDHANVIRSPTIKTARSADTCADLSSAKTVFQAFEASLIAHILKFRYAFEDSNTRNKAIVWGDLHPAFNAWPTQQNFTVPLFQLGAADGTEFRYRIGTDAQTPPVLSGFSPDALLVGWVYDSQVCGSVPLMSVVLGGAFTDNYVTTDPFEHDGLISSGWTDDGVVAFVLPLNT